MKVAASPQRINRAMPEGGIQVTSHQSLISHFEFLIQARFSFLVKAQHAPFPFF